MTAAGDKREPLRVGLVGGGWMGQTHAKAWRDQAPRGRIVAVADVSEARAREISDRFTDGAARVYTSLDSLLAGREVDAVDLCLPHHLHRDGIVAAAGAGVHVLCEKPLCLTFDEAREIRDVLAQAGVVFMSAHNNLFAPGLVEARRRLAAGSLGRVYVVRSVEAGRNAMMKSGKPPLPLAAGESSWSWRLDPARAGGGEVLDTGWHGAYRLLALAGSRPTEVTALLADYYIGQPEVEDTGALLVRFENGAIGLLLTSWAFGDPPGSDQFVVGAELGSLAGNATRLVVAPHGQPAEEQRFEPASTFSAELRHFLDVVQLGEPCVSGWAEAARTLQLILGAYRAAAEHRAVVLPPDATTL